MRILLIVFTFLLSLQLNAQEKYTLSGKVKDASNGEDLIGATVFIKEINNGIISNEYGFYSITLPQGIYTVNISYQGFTVSEKSVELNSNLKLDVELNQEATQLEEVVVTGKAQDKNIKDIR